MMTHQVPLCDCCDLAVHDWIRLERHSPSYISQLRSRNIVMLSDCGRLAFSDLTNIFNSLTHRTLRDKIRFERDLTARHMRYRMVFKSMQRHRQFQLSQVKMAQRSLPPATSTATSTATTTAVAAKHNKSINDEITMIVESVMNKHENAPSEKLNQASTTTAVNANDDYDDDEDEDGDKETTGRDRTKSAATSTSTSTSVADVGSIIHANNVSNTISVAMADESDTPSPSSTILSSSPPSSTTPDGKPETDGDDVTKRDAYDEEGDDRELEPTTLFLDANKPERTQTQAAVTTALVENKSMMRLVTERGLYKDKTIKRKTRKNVNCKTQQQQQQQTPKQKLGVSPCPPDGGGPVGGPPQYDGIRFVFLWMYKAVVMHFVALNAVPMPEKKVFDSLYYEADAVRNCKEDAHKYRVEVTMAPGFAIRCSGLGSTELAAEYDAYFHVFEALATSTAPCMDHSQFSRLVQTYRVRNSGFNHLEWNRWWFDLAGVPRHDIFEYFPDIRELKKTCRQSTPAAKAVYLSNVNRNFHVCHGAFISDAGIQMLFYHAVSFVFPFKKHWLYDPCGNLQFENQNELHASLVVTRKRQDMLMFLMQTYHFRKEFFENLMKQRLPICDLLDFMN